MAIQHNLKTIRDRCNVVGDCWLWTMACANQGRTPVIGYTDADGKTRTRSVRHLVAELANLPIDQKKPTRTKCHDPLCVYPDHIRPTSQKELHRLTSKTKKPTASPARTLANRKRGKINLEIAEAIRTSTEAGTVEAKKHGISPQLVSAIRRGKAWVTPASNPFAGLIK